MVRITADWLRARPTQSILSMLVDGGWQAFAVGGCVRDSLLNRRVKDIDIATDARPDEVVRLAEAHGFHAIPTGIDHGTVTVVADHMPHEITTFRRDVETDGRRAVVAFSDRMIDDARRRDFTMNALYADRSGKISDPIGGLPDLEARRIRFIEDAPMRIREDYLRSLRFFRFHAWYGDAGQGFDPDAMAAISENVDGLELLSRERVGAEVKRLLAAPDPVSAVAGMRSTGVLQAILPGTDDRALGPLVHLEATHGVKPDPIRRLASFGGQGVATALRLSRKEAGQLAALTKDMGALPAHELGYRHGAGTARDILLLEAAATGSLLDETRLIRARDGADQTFSMKAADLMPEVQGPALGACLSRLEQDWIDSNFKLTRAELLARVAKEG